MDIVGTSPLASSRNLGTTSLSLAFVHRFALNDFSSFPDWMIKTHEKYLMKKMFKVVLTKVEQP